MPLRGSITIEVYTDGGSVRAGLEPVKTAFDEAWATHYANYADLSFADPINVKKTKGEDLPDKLEKIVEVRNPDFYFASRDPEIELGGVEVSLHSPDGSNAEKRYPFLWKSRVEGTHAFMAIPYSKQRSSGSVNRLPNRHAKISRDNLNEWEPFSDESKPACVYTPIHQLQDPPFPKPEVQDRLLHWSDLGKFFAHALAAQILADDEKREARRRLVAFKTKVSQLTDACLENTSYTSPNTQIETGGRYVQTYNTRPDTGHWERGEGQFDSIDGRLMLSLDELHHQSRDDLPDFEFWLPQLSRNHAWVRQQRRRGYGSKRLKNIMVTLAQQVEVKFSEDLTPDDWEVLKDNSNLTLERLDWKVGIFRVSDIVGTNEIYEVARKSLRNPSDGTIEKIVDVISDPRLFFSSHRAYKKDWKSSLLSGLNQLPSGAQILVPRIPRGMLGSLLSRLTSSDITVKAAGECDQYHLMALRQIHRKANSSDQINNLFA